MASIYSKFKEARASGGGRRYKSDGDHIVRIDGVTFDKSRKGIEYFAVEDTIVTSTNANMKPGQKYDWSTHADKDPYAGNVKNFICAIAGCSEEEINAQSDADFDKLMEGLTGKEQLAVGRFVGVRCVTKRSDKTGKDYTAHNWQALSPEEEQRAAVMYEALKAQQATQSAPAGAQ